MFYKGLLDSALADKCKTLDPSFEFDELRFLREELLQDHLQAGSQDIQLERASRQKLLAEFSLFQAELKAEQVLWQSYLAQRSEVEDAELSSRVALQEKHQDALTAAVAEHQENCYRTICVPTWSAAGPFLEAALGAFSGVAPMRPSEEVWRLNVVNCCCLGTQASLARGQVAALLTADHAHHPEKTLSIVILPNMPEWGHWPQPCPSKPMRALNSHTFQL